MPNCHISESFLHVVGHDSLLASEHLSISSSCIVLLICIVFHVFEFRVLHQFLFATCIEGFWMNCEIIFLFQIQLFGSEGVLIGIPQVGGRHFGEKLGTNFFLQPIIYFHPFFRLVNQIVRMLTFGIPVGIPWSEVDGLTEEPMSFPLGNVFLLMDEPRIIIGLEIADCAFSDFLLGGRVRAICLIASFPIAHSVTQNLFL